LAENFDAPWSKEALSSALTLALLPLLENPLKAELFVSSEAKVDSLSAR